MELNRFYCNSIDEPVCELFGSEAHHLASVLRLKKGDNVELFDGCGKVVTACISSVSNRKVILDVEDLKVFSSSAKPKIILAVSIPKGERFDWLISKCTELGIDRIVPVIFDRTVKQPKNPKIYSRWQNITISAAKQCRRIFLPQIDNTLPVSNALEIIRKDFPNAEMLYGSLSEQADTLINQDFSNSDLVIFIGPEGGFTEAELTFIDVNKIKPMRITDTILRVETAAIACVSILAAKRDERIEKKVEK